MRAHLSWHWIPSFIHAVSLAGLLLGAQQNLLAQTVTSNPANGATGVSVDAPVVFTFSSAVDPTSVTSSFISLSPFGAYTVTESWNAANTVLTCTPDSPWPANVTITWYVAEDSGAFFATGTFTAGTGGGPATGSGTNKFTTFGAGKLYFYDQTNSSAPTPAAFAAYAFTASVSLASNIAATAVSVTLPTGGAPQGLSQNFQRHEVYSLFASSTASNTFEATYPQGPYAFTVTTASSNLQATVNLPTTMTQPNAPHVSNFAAAQSVNPTQPFTLNWDAFQGGTAADYIKLTVIDDFGKTVFETPDPGTNGALPGTALSATIPAGKLAANVTNSADLIFYRFVGTTNVTYATLAFRASGTQFEIVTPGAAVTVPVVSNPVVGPKGFGFDVATTLNQSIKVRSSTDLSLPIAQWPTVFTTNSPGASLHIDIPIQAGGTAFFRVQSGP